MTLGLQAESFSSFSLLSSGRVYEFLPHRIGLENDPKHAAQRLRGSPEQLVSDSKCGEIFAAHGQLAQPSDGDRELAGHCGGRELAPRLLAPVPGAFSPRASL